MRTKSIIAGILGCIVVVLVFGIVSYGRKVPFLKAGVERIGLLAQAPSEVRQFRAGDQILGFSATGVSIIAGNRTLKLEFIDALPVQPIFFGAGREELKSSGTKAIPPLNEAVYPELWKGIVLKYGRGSGDSVKSSYEIAAGADPDSIRLKANVPVTIDQEGFLRYRFESGEMIESKPVAWQETEGGLVDIGAAFIKHGEKEIGFVLGDYDRTRPLIIDPVISCDPRPGPGFLGDQYFVLIDSLSGTRKTIRITIF